VFLVLAHDRRRILHFGVTAHPTTEWTAQQLGQLAVLLVADRDRIFGADSRRTRSKSRAFGKCWERHGCEHTSSGSSARFGASAWTM
jgi:hypothetical protein